MNQIVAILGGGPAGLSCALWLKQLGLAPVVIERLPELGGIQRSSHYVNNYYLGHAGQSGRELAEQFVRHARTEGLATILGEPIASITRAGNHFAIRAGGTLIEAQAIVVATGQRVKGPETLAALPAKWAELSDLVSFDPGQTPLLAKKVHGQVVAVAGGGDNAMSTSVMLGATAAHVHLLSRGPLRGFQVNLEAVRRMELAGRLTRHQPAEIQRLECCNDCIQYVFQTTGGRLQTGLADYVCFRLGFAPNTKEVRELLVAGGVGALSLTTGGHITTDRFLRTAIPRVYAAGDVTNVRDACVATAVAQGAVAARSVEEDLQG